MTDSEKLTNALVKAGATRERVIEIIDSYGDSIDWKNWTIENIIAEVWHSDINSGNEPEHYIINEICRAFNIDEVKE